ncbi:MAG: translation elongation factor Ts [Clostridiales bacterium]|nr:translation elongation factor Ts [Clostridiales bacterium]
MAVTAAMIKTLREATNAGVSDCKAALTAADGDFDRAVEILREKGLAAAAKKAGRIASEGIVTALVSDDGKKGVILEINSETDFVAKNADFKAYVGQVASQALSSNSQSIESFLDEKWSADESISVKDALVQKIAVIGERLDIRRFERFERSSSGALVSYIHGGRIAVLLELESEAEGKPELTEAGKNVCMQIASMTPRFVDRNEISEEFIAKEKEILTQQTLTEEAKREDSEQNYRRKPENVLDKIIANRLEKELNEFSLVDQEYVRATDMPEEETKGKKLYTVSHYLAFVGKKLGAKISVKRFARYETGEGLAKKSENFAEEVSKAMQS